MKLSIITINFDNCLGLKKTIQSVISQTFSDYEYIIIDGGSNDGSVKVINDFAIHFSYWVSEKDNGIYYAMNKAINVAKGEYLLFLHSGDVLNGNIILETIFKQDCSLDILYGDIIYFDPNFNRNLETQLPSNLDLFFFYKQSLWHQASFIKRKLFEVIGLYNENNKYVSDWEFFMEAIIFNQATYKKIDMVITQYDMYNGISILRKEDSENEKREILKCKIKEPFLEVLKRVDLVTSELQLLYKSDSYIIQRWFNKHPDFLKLLIFLSKISFSAKRK